MIIERIKLTAHPAGRLQLSKALVSLTGPTAVSPGCMDCNVFQSFQDDNELLVEMNWESPEDLMCHLKSDTYKRLLLLMELSPRPPVIQFYSVQELRGLDLVEAARSSSD